MVQISNNEDPLKQKRTSTLIIPAPSAAVAVVTADVAGVAGAAIVAGAAGAAFGGGAPIVAPAPGAVVPPPAGAPPALI